MAITYHAGRRIQGSSTDTVETITFSDNSFTSGWDKAGTQIATNSGTGEIDWNARVNGTNHSLVHDLQNELGSGVYLDTKYVARFEITIDVIQSGGFSGGNNINFGFSGSDESVGYDGTSQDFHGIKLSHDGGGSGSYIIKHVAVNNSGIGAGTSFAETFTTQTYYVELVRDGDDFTTKLLDSNYSVLTEEESTTVTNIQLQYFKITEDDGFSSSANFSGTVDNIKIWNGVTSISSKPSNVQVGSRFEETDTRKMYNYDDEVSSTSASTATTENDNGVNEQVMSSANFEFIGEKVVNSSSALYGLTVNKIGFMMKKREGSPTGTATACVMDSSANILYTFGTVDVSTLPSTYTWTYFTNTLSTYTLTTGNYIGIKYNGGDVNNRIGVYWDNAGSYDGTNSQGSEESGGAWNDRSAQDLRFKIFTGTAFIPKQWSEIGT